MPKQDSKMMERIWENLPKSPDNDHITLVMEDLMVLWETGFVDTEANPPEKWVQLFEPYKQGSGEDVKFILGKNDFLEKENYRYKGDIKIPFEPMQINEGKYTDEGLQDLIDMSIQPSCSFTKKELHDFFVDLKEKYRDKSDGLIVIEMPAKREILDLILKNPSPLHRLEMIFFATFLNVISQQAPEAVKATPEQTAKIHLTNFTTLPSSMEEQASIGLKGITKAKTKKAAAVNDDEAVMLKKVKRSRKGMRG